MAASNSTNSTEGQRSEKRPESPQDTAPEVVPTPKSETEAEELRKRKRAQLEKQKASTDPEDNTDEGAGTSEAAEPVDPEPSSTGANEPAHFVAELAVVSMHEDLDYEISDAPPMSSYDTNVPEGPDSDVEMTDAPPLSSYDTNVPEGPESFVDVQMVDAPPLQPDAE